MNKRFEYRIAVVMLVALALVSVTGIYAYRQFSQVVFSLGKDVLPDLRLVTAKAVMNGLSDAENSVKSYNLTKDSLYLDQFNSAVGRTERSIKRLRELTAEEAASISQLDSIDSLVVKKFDLLNEWLRLGDPYRANVALNKAVLKLKAAVEQNGKGQFSADEVSQQLQKVKKEEALVASVMREREMKLISTNNQITDRINRRLQELEKSELQRLSVKTRNAEKTVQTINMQMALFFVLMGALLFVMAFVILGYVKNNDRYRKALQLAKNEAEEHARSREKFLANMSHEIRTPMNAIAGFTEQLSEGDLDPEQQEQLSMVRRSTDHLLHVINEILDLTKLQSDKLQLEKVGFVVRMTVNEAVSMLQPLAEQKGLQLTTSVQESVPEVVLGDPYRLRQMLLNLVGNAIKFTEEGSVSVNVSVHENRLTVEVSDTGIGISEEKAKKVFEEFEQAESSTTRNYGGTGLGLSIVHRLVKLHQGKIQLKSELGKGTIITLDLPYEIGSEADLPKKEPALIEQKLLRGLNILIVDDEPFNRKLLATILLKQGANYVEAENGKHALAQINKQEFDLVLLDARMPEMDGLTATEAIRKLADRKKNSVPIIILSAAATLDDREKYDLAAINGFLAKPFKETEFLNVVRNALSEIQKVEEVKIDNALDGSATDLDFSELMELSGNDAVFFREMLQTFFDGTKKGLTDIQYSLSENDALQVAEHAHRISAPCKHLSATKLHAQLRGLEDEARRNYDIEALKKLFSAIEMESENVLQQVDKELNK